MALAGGGAICIWNDITDEGRDDFYAWHLHEHMPERAAIPGFLRGRRYRSLDPETRPEFFTLYETRDTSILTGADYLARLNAPTDWTRRATQGFRNTARALTHVAASLGPGPGGVIATLRFAVPEKRAAEAIKRISYDCLPAAAATAQICGAHLCLTDDSASASKTAESRDRKDIQTAPSWVILLESCNIEPARDAAGALAKNLADLAGDSINAGFYRLEYERAASDGARDQA